MRAVTWNIRHGTLPGERCDLEALGEFCADLRPDVLALQEVDRGALRSGRADMEAVVRDATGMASVFGQAKRLGLGGRYGNVLLVRGDMSDVEHLRLPRDARREQRTAILASARLDRLPVPVSILATHLGVTRAEALRQLGVCLNALSRRPAPRLLLGDLNLGPETVVAACADADLELADPDLPTFPADDPEYRIDHVAFAGLEAVSVAVAEAPVSDHRAVVVEFRRP